MKRLCFLNSIANEEDIAFLFNGLNNKNKSL